MCRIFKFFFCLKLLACLSGFTGVAWAGPAKKPLILVSVFPIEAMVREIAGDKFDVRPALPYGRSEHDYEPSPKEVRTLKSANLLIVVDQATDGWMVAAAGKNVPAMELLGHVDPETYGTTIGAKALGEVSARSMSVQLDPHFWTDPARMGKAARVIGQRLVEMTRPEPGAGKSNAKDVADDLAKSIEARVVAFERRMTKVQGAMIAASRGWPNASVILAHGSLGYFSRVTGLKIVGVLEPVPHMEPGPRHLRDLIVAAKAGKPCVVLAEEQIDDAAARALAREANVRIARINPLGSTGVRRDTDQTVEAYDRYMSGLVEEVGRGLTGK
jgi:ABC-type Zn uptake system ZnuABC Zn-binding protein ZnuA